MPELPDPPSAPPHAGDERALLTTFLDYQRQVMLRKVIGVSDEDLRRPMTESNVTLLGIVKHLGYVERDWFQDVFLGQDVETPWTDEDRDADWRIEPGEETDVIVAFYRDEIAKANEITAASDLDAVAARPEAGGVTMRWILVHMIEETARHLGHADLIRERIDGVVGD